MTQVIRMRKVSPPATVESSEDVTVHRETLRSFLEDALKKIVDNSRNISVSFMVGERTTVYNVSCTQEELGKIIGAKGKTINSLRVITLAMSSRMGFRSVIEIPYFPDNN
ncbi:KH domain-containing protein [Bdellovibrio sp.]|uniref:KH domain-containing protein n=1 Tax=Bdellovibrio sp. TaxID=28201 RepID=UPI0039E69DC7